MEHVPIVSATSYDLELSRTSWERLSAAALMCRIRAGCVYDAHPSDTFGLLVTRAVPRTQRGRQRGLTPIHAHWPLFAPSVQLLTGHETACRSRRCHGDGRCEGHTPFHLGWPAFAAAYRAELETWPILTRLAVARQVVAWLRTAPTVTVLSFERRTPQGSPPDCWAQRHIFRDWLRSLLPLAIPLGAAQVRTAVDGMLRGGAPRQDV
jgi:hypothetical protein